MRCEGGKGGEEGDGKRLTAQGATRCRALPGRSTNSRGALIAPSHRRGAATLDPFPFGACAQGTWHLFGYWVAPPLGTAMQLGIHARTLLQWLPLRRSPQAEADSTLLPCLLTLLVSTCSSPLLPSFPSYPSVAPYPSPPFPVYSVTFPTMLLVQTRRWLLISASGSALYMFTLFPLQAVHTERHLQVQQGGLRT